MCNPECDNISTNRKGFMRYRCYAKYHQVVSSNWFSTYARTSISTTWAFDEASQWANTWFNNLLNFHSRDSISLARVIIHSSVVVLLLLSFFAHHSWYYLMFYDNENGIKTHINGEYERLFVVPSKIYDLQKSFGVFGYVRACDDQIREEKIWIVSERRKKRVNKRCATPLLSRSNNVILFLSLCGQKREVKTSARLFHVHDESTRLSKIETVIEINNWNGRKKNQFVHSRWRKWFEKLELASNQNEKSKQIDHKKNYTVTNVLKYFSIQNRTESVCVVFVLSLLSLNIFRLLHLIGKLKPFPYVSIRAIHNSLHIMCQACNERNENGIERRVQEKETTTSDSVWSRQCYDCLRHTLKNPLW